MSEYTLVHPGNWHARFQDCSYIKCGYGLGITKIGLQHWSCCFQTAHAAVGCTKLDNSKISEIKELRERIKELEGKIDSLDISFKELEKRVSIIEFSPPKDGGPEFRKIENEEFGQIL